MSAIPDSGLIVVAGGSGTRMASPVKKAFIELGGRALVLRSLDAFRGLPWLVERVVVLPPDVIEAESGKASATDPAPHAGKSALMRELAAAGVKTCVPGGVRRQDSVLNGLKALGTRCQLALVHDAARPFVEKKHVVAVAQEAEECGAAILVCDVRDTVKRVDSTGTIIETVDRAPLRAAQTPQAFDRAKLLDAFARFGTRDVTDDAMLFELAGWPVRAVAGSPANFKITSPEDLALAEWLLGNRAGG